MAIYRVTDSNNRISVHRCEDALVAMQAHVNHLSNEGIDERISTLHADLTDESFCKSKKCRNFIKSIGI